MFCLIYFPNIGEDPKSDIRDISVPNALEISQSQTILVQHMEDKAIQKCIDEVGRKNFVNTLDEKQELDTLTYPIYPTLVLKRGTDSISVHRVEKKQVVLKGYLYNSTKDNIEISHIGTYYVVPVESWRYDDLPSRPEEEKKKIVKPLETKRSGDVYNNYDRVLLQLIQTIQSRKSE
jgi:hypothetical protein